MPCMIGPNGPLISTIWLIFVLPAAPEAGSIRQLNRNIVPGTTLVSNTKDRPG